VGGLIQLNGAKKPSMVEQNELLQRMYLRLRRRYWTTKHLKLPALTKVVVAFVRMDEFEGRHVFDSEKRDPDQISYLLIDAALMGCPEDCERVLLHEMAHLYVDRHRKAKGESSHGPMWKAEMTRLFMAGAFWPHL
jgi:hypothetical protein